MNDLKQLLEQYGVDHGKTMERFMGDEALYVKLLGLTLADESLARLGGALSANDPQAAFEAAHTLKGVAANMGLTPYYERICAILEPLRRNEKRDDYPALYQALEAEFKRVQELYKKLRV